MFTGMGIGQGQDEVKFGSPVHGYKGMVAGIGEKEDGVAAEFKNFSWDVNMKVVHSLSRVNNFLVYQAITSKRINLPYFSSSKLR